MLAPEVFLNLVVFYNIESPPQIIDSLLLNVGATAIAQRLDSIGLADCGFVEQTIYAISRHCRFLHIGDTRIFTRACATQRTRHNK